MITRLRGILLEKSPPRLTVDINGVAYELEASLFSCYRLPPVGKEVTLHTHLVVREDAHLLYGFSDEQERVLFRHLIKVNGVGPKLALAILSGIEPDNFVSCVMQANTDSLVNIPGVGKKTAERLVIEMRDKLNDWKLDFGQRMTSMVFAQDQPSQEAISALTGLGYKLPEARQAVVEAAKSHQSSEEIIRYALRSMVKN